MYRNTHPRLARRARLLAGVGAAMAFTGTAMAQSADRPETYVTPYLEVDQTVTGELSGGGSHDVLTYTDVTAGVDAGIYTHRVEAEISYQYQHRFSESGHLDNGDVQSGLASAQINVVPGEVSIEGGALAQRGNNDFSDGSIGLPTQDSKNVSTVYGAYVQPTVQHDFGEVHAKGQYQLGYVAVDDNNDRVFTGQDRYDHSLNQQAYASIGMDPNGSLPFGWNIVGLFDQEDLNRLKQRFRQETVIGEAVVPVASTFALIGDVGYEKITNSSEPVVLDGSGLPVVNGNGNFVAASGSRFTFYDQSGVVYEGGFIWHPSHRTRLEARAGHRYGGTTVTGSFDHSFTPSMAFHAEVYDQINSFGRSIIGGLVRLPTSFIPTNSPLLTGGCVFGSKPGTGTCFSDNGLIGTANFRDRGVFGVLSGKRGRTEWGFGFGYDNQRFLAGRNGVEFGNNHEVDQSYLAQAYWNRELTERSGLRLDLFGARYVSNTFGINSEWSGGATLGYSRLLMSHLEGQAQAGLFVDALQDDQTDVEGSLLLGLRYSF